MATLEEIAARLRLAKRVAIVTHTRPDGDALGGALALAVALKKLNIEGQVCVESEIPPNLCFLKGLERVQKKPSGKVDLWVALDCSDETRLGALQTDFAAAKRARIDTVNIDHHVSNTRFAHQNYVRECAANAINVAALIELLGVPFDADIAEYLFVGLASDSGNFSHDDVTEETFLLAAKLVSFGVDVRLVGYELFKKQTRARAKLYARAIDGMRYALDGRFAFVVTAKKTIEECGASVADTEGYADFPLSVEGVEIAAALLEVRRGQYKISLRSKTYADVNRLAATFGGGGHPRAAGCMLFGELEDVLDRLTYVVSQYLED